MKNSFLLLIISLIAFNLQGADKNTQQENGIYSTYGDTSFSGLNGVMDTYFDSNNLNASKQNFNGIRTEIEPQHPSQSHGLNGIMDVVEKTTVDKITSGIHDVHPLKTAFYFSTNNFQLSQQDVTTLQNIIPLLQNTSISKIYITGFTDPTGSRDYNKKLSVRRAESLKNQLIQLGVQQDKITSTGAGIDYQQPEYKKARRVELSVLIP